ncbi:MAG: hydrolase [Deltaproteobacteria bacterium]|nr:MAG: hydrolase [Deltaproteobacteria bacterium]
MADLGISRDEAYHLLNEMVTQDNLKKHCLATEVIMRDLASKLGYDPDLWGIAGLLHDLDFEETKDDPQRHGLVTAKILEEKNVSKEIIDAIKAHNAEALGIERKNPIDFAITAAETITGMVVATTLVYPDKKIKSVKPKSILKRMKAKEFARRVNRDHIKLCEKLGIPLAEFAELSLKAMSKIDKELGL